MPEAKETAAFDPDTLQDMLPLYYKRLFPHKQFYRWLSYNNCEFALFTKIFAPKLTKYFF